MITIVNIILYFLAVFSGAVFGSIDMKTDEGKNHALFWVGSTGVFFILAVVTHVFN